MGQGKHAVFWGGGGCAPIDATACYTKHSHISHIFVKLFHSFCTMLKLFFRFPHHHFHFNALQGVISAVAFLGHDFVRHLHAFDHFAKGRILTIEMGGSIDHNKKLRPGAIGVPRARHGQDTARVRRVIELCFHVVTRPSRTILAFVFPLGIGIAALNHKIWDHTVKNGAIVKPGCRQFDKVFHMLRCFLWKKFELHVAEFRLDDGFWRRLRHARQHPEHQSQRADETKPDETCQYMRCTHCSEPSLAIEFLGAFWQNIYPVSRRMGAQALGGAEGA